MALIGLGLAAIDGRLLTARDAILGPHPEVENFFFVNGFSGHGLQQSAGAGRAVAELIAFGAYQTLDLRRFSFDRIVSSEALQELAVV